MPKNGQKQPLGCTYKARGDSLLNYVPIAQLFSSKLP